MTKGWYNDRYEHSLASRGIKINKTIKTPVTEIPEETKYDHYETNKAIEYFGKSTPKDWLYSEFGNSWLLTDGYYLNNEGCHNEVVRAWGKDYEPGETEEEAFSLGVEANAIRVQKKSMGGSLYYGFFGKPTDKQMRSIAETIRLKGGNVYFDNYTNEDGKTYENAKPTDIYKWVNSQYFIEDRWK